MPSPRTSLDARATELTAQFDAFARRFIIPQGIAADDRAPLTRLELRVIAAVGDHPNGRTGNLAGDLMMSLSSLSSLLDRLARRRLIHRRRSLEDRRVVHVELTANGRACCARFQRRRLQIARGMLQALTEEERATFIALMQKIGAKAGGNAPGRGESPL